MTDSKQNLVSRWTTEEGKSLLKEIIVRLTKVKSLEDLKGLNRIEGKFDLRGISFPKEYSEYDYKGKHMKQIVGSLSKRLANRKADHFSRLSMNMMM